MNGCNCQRIIACVNCNAVPLLFRASVINICQLGVEEGHTANGDHTVGDDDTCQTSTVCKCFDANAGHTVRDGYACQPVAITEGIFANGGQLAVFTKCHTCQTGALIEGSIANFGHAVGDDYACQTVAITEGI